MKLGEDLKYFNIEPQTMPQSQIYSVLNRFVLKNAYSVAGMLMHWCDMFEETEEGSFFR